VFTVGERNAARARLLEMAGADDRIVAGAELGALTTSAGDRWSDLDLTFGVADGTRVEDVLADWTAQVERELGAVHLFDLPFQTTIYRVFLLRSNLQIDLSFTPQADFGARGPKFRLLFGEAVDRDYTPPPPPHHLFGLGVHHAVRGRICVERGRLWQAEYWISALRDEALALASSRHGLEPSYGRGFDGLPTETMGLASAAIVASVEREELLRGLHAAVELLLREAGEIPEIRESASKLAPQLRELTSTTGAAR
jgi:hypothetical protein